jgi:hypothetical protein
VSIKLQMIFDDGQVVQFAAGGPVEVELQNLVTQKQTDAIVAAIMSQPVGFFRTKAQVQRAVQEGVASGLKDGVAEAILEFKRLSLKAKI